MPLVLGVVACLITGLYFVWHSPERDPTDSSSRDGFQEGSDIRGTMDIIYGCLSTMAICTYSVVHPDIPPIRLHRMSIGEKLSSGLWWLSPLQSALNFLSTFFAPVTRVTE